MEESAVCVFLRDTTTAIWLATLQNTTAKYPTPSVSTNCSQGTTKGCSPTCISYGRCRPWMPVAPELMAIQQQSSRTRANFEPPSQMNKVADSVIEFRLALRLTR